jgi:tripartite-type tricarboxylate transporter receptor subunit TctC
VFFGVNGVAPTVENWEFYIAGGSPGVFAVLSKSPYKDLKSLVKIARESPDQIKIGNSGRGKLWHIKAAQLGKFAGVKFQHIPYEGSAPAIMALVSEEVDVVSCSADEIFEYVRSGTARPITVTEIEGFEFDGFGYVESATELFPETKYCYSHLFQWLGFLVPKDVPSRVKEEFDGAFMSALNDSTTVELMVKQKVQWMGITGEKAKDLMIKMQSYASWISKDMGIAKIDPADLGIKPLSEF